MGSARCVEPGAGAPQAEALAQRAALSWLALLKIPIRAFQDVWCGSRTLDMAMCMMYEFKINVSSIGDGPAMSSGSEN
jgi:hypothetical protein